MPSIFALLGIVCLLAGLFKILFTAFFSPLSAFPNAHYSAPFSGLWLLSIKARKRENRTRAALHKRLGPVIRIGPQELSVNDANGVKTIYGGGFDKGSWYSMFRNYGLVFMVSMLESKPHTERKRMMNHVYTNSYIQTSPELEDILQAATKDIVSRVETWAREGAEIDIYKLTKSFGMDCTSGYVFGQENATHFVEESMAGGNPLKIFEVGLSHMFLQSLQAEVPRIVEFLTWFGVRVVPDYVSGAWQSVEELCFKKCAAAKENLLCNSGKEFENRRKHPTVYAQLYRKLEEVEASPEKLDKVVAAEMLDHALAANEGAGITLTYLMWEVSNHASIHQKLRDEIRGCRNSKNDPLIPTKHLESLPVLDAVLQETMRLYPAAFGPFPRVVPQKGAKIGNVDVPAGTLVSTSTYALHRNPAVFPEPEQWRPERWLEANAETRKEMQRWFWAFGSGSRMCIGNYFALRMLKTFVVAIYADFETITVDERPEQADSLMAILEGPVGNRVLMKFRKCMAIEEEPSVV